MSATGLCETITTFLDESELTYQEVESNTTDKVFVAEICGDNGNWRVFIQVTDDDEVRRVMMRAHLPARTPENNRLKVAELLTRINYDLIVGNFEMNLDDGEVIYKTCLDLADGVVTPAMFDRMYDLNSRAMNHYYAKILNAGYGELEQPKIDDEMLPDGAMLQ